MYWPTMVVDVYAHVAKCHPCAKNRLQERKHTSSMKLCPATEPFASVSMDLLAPFPKSENGYKHLLVICDRFTKLVRVVPLRDTTSLDVVSTFIDTWVASYRLPDTTLTDNGPQFASEYIQGVLGFLGIVANYSTPYHPQTNGQVERYNRTIVRQLRTYMAEHTKEWDRYVSLLTTAYNMHVHTSTGQAPFAFVSPRRLQTMGISRLPKPRPHVENEEDEEDLDPSVTSVADQYFQYLKALIPKVREHLGRTQKAYKKAFDARVSEKNKDIGVGAWIYTDAHARQRAKLAFKTAGPYMVLQTDGRRFLVSILPEKRIK